MANFDPNQWYHIYTNGNNETAFKGTSLYNNGSTGTAYFTTAEIDKPWQQWQIYPVDSTYFVLRTGDSGPDGFLAAKYGNSNIPSGILATTMRGNLTDDSVYWQIQPWGNGYHFLTNKVNGSTWHLRDVNTQAAMDSNLTKPDKPNGQSFYFEKISAINDKKYSTVNLPTATNSSPGTPSPTTSPASTSTSANITSSGGLSTAVKAGIGAGVGGVVLIALVVLGLFLFRRRKRQQAPAYQQANPDDQTYTERYAYKQDPSVDTSYIGSAKAELFAESDAKHEMPVEQRPVVELPATQHPIEAGTKTPSHWMDAHHESAEQREILAVGR